MFGRKMNNKEKEGGEGCKHGIKWGKETSISSTFFWTLDGVKMEGNKVIISSSSFLAKKVEDKILLYHLHQINVTLVKNNCKSITSHINVTCQEQITYSVYSGWLLLSYISAPTIFFRIS